MTLISAVLVLFISALLYRLGGSGFGADWPERNLVLFHLRGDRLVKVMARGLGPALACWAGGVCLVLVLGVFVLTTACDAITSHGKYQEGQPSGWVAAMLDGIMTAVPAALALAVSAHVGPALAAIALGMLTGPVYWIGAKTPLQINLPLLPARQGPEIGEWLLGAVRVAFVLVH
jgi:hypothetical protein